MVMSEQKMLEVAEARLPLPNFSPTFALSGTK